LIIPNCDFNRPCDCIDCRTIYEHIICPKCNFTNHIRIVRNSLGYSYDRKVVGGYDFEIPTEPIKDLKCFKCGFQIEKVGYYTEVDIDSNKRELEREEKIAQNKFCSKCKKVEKMDMVLGFENLNVILKEKNGENLCQECYAEKMKNEIPDPSTDKEKYYFEKRQLKWVLEKIKVTCERCGKARWLNAENHWKKLCLKCYKESKK